MYANEEIFLIGVDVSVSITSDFHLATSGIKLKWGAIQLVNSLFSTVKMFTVVTSTRHFI